jgi:threonyl-tRNA synthetase
MDSFGANLKIIANMAVGFDNIDLEEAKKRDHRKLGKELGLFAFSDYVGPGLPLWLPNGTVIINELERLAKDTERAAGYLEVRTPHIAKELLYKTSGHLPYYAQSMFPPMELNEDDGTTTTYYLRAMNCPHHHQIYAAAPRSYRDLPLRLAEYGTVYRYEKSGELFGLMRVRMLSMNDAHIYCTPEQFEQEFRAVNDLYIGYFNLFGITKYVMRFSTHASEGLGKKYVDDAPLWKKTEDMVRGVLQRSGVTYIEVPDEAAFYGPKIDVQVWSSIGREFTLATNQVDFAVPVRFGLTYVDATGKPQTPLVIHRAPLGTHERLIGFLIEHYAGKFPLWLAPVQATVIPIGADHRAYATTVSDALRNAGVRVTLASDHATLGKRIREAQVMHIPYVLVVGSKEKAAQTTSVRHRDRGDLGAITLDEIVKKLAASIRDRRED